MQKRKVTFLKYFYAITGIVWFFFGMTSFQSLSRRYAQYTADIGNIIYWLPTVATIAFLVGWVSGLLVYRGQTVRARVLLLLAALSSWLLVMVSVAIIFGVDASAISQSAGADVGLRLFSLIFAAYNLSASRVAGDVLGKKTS